VLKKTGDLPNILPGETIPTFTFLTVRQDAFARGDAACVLPHSCIGSRLRDAGQDKSSHRPTAP